MQRFDHDVAAVNVSFTYWKVTVATVRDEDIVAYFWHESDARLAVEWAYQVRLDELRLQPDTEEIQEEDDRTYDDNYFCKQLTWWVSAQNGGGYIPVKQYFIATKEEWKRRING